MASSIINSDDGSVSGTTGLKTTGGDDGELILQTNGADSVTLSPSAVVINESGADVDFRVEGDTEANLLFVDAGNDRVGLTTGSPKSLLDLGDGSGGVTATPSASYSDYAIALYASTTTDQIRNFVGVGEGSAVAAGIGFYDHGTGGKQGIIFNTGNLTATAEAMRIDSTGNLSFNSGYGSSAIAYGCRAWVNFNGTGTVAIRAAGNVSSITDNGTGNYTVNFTNAMTDANYAVNFGVGGGGGGLNASFVGGVLTTTQYGTASNKTTTALQFTTGDYTATPRDLGEIYVSIFR